MCATERSSGRALSVSRPARSCSRSIRAFGRRSDPLVHEREPASTTMARMDSERALMVWDGDCGFCRGWIARWRRITGDRVEYAPYQQVAERFPEIPRAEFARAVHLRRVDGTWTRGAEAVFAALALAPGGARFGAWLYRRVPPFAAASEWAYRIVARHRPFFTRVTNLVWGEHVVPPGEAVTVALFLRGFGLVALAAFVSLGVQVVGLLGKDGVLPAADFLAAARAQLGPGASLALPSLAWLGPSDAMLQALCWAGAAASVLLALGILPLASLLTIAITYISLGNVGRDFLEFQWDGLLIETAVVALFLAPAFLRLRPARDPAPSRMGLALVRWLLFRLMFSSAVVKLASGDPTWRGLTALRFHYLTQPLPTWVAWYAHRLAPTFQSFSVVMLFGIEGLAPFLVLAPRRIRFAGAWTLIALQLLIALTGNYGFFNLLAILLCVPLFDDAVWPRWLARLVGAPRDLAPSEPLRGPGSLAHRFVRRPLAIALVPVGLVPLWGSLGLPMRTIVPLPYAYALTTPFRIVNPYGLFAVMTTERREIVIEGSDDGVTWREYGFRWKPGALDRRPAFLAPHMPRLDWQMWFAALGSLRENLWFLTLCERLLQGSPPVLRLLGTNPFPHAPPRYVRATFWRYRFTTPAERRAEHRWWEREPLGLYAPPLTLEGGRLAPANLPGAP